MSVRLTIAVCAGCLAPLAGALADPAPAGGLEYDEIGFLNADLAAHPPGAFDGDLAAIKTAALNGQLGTVDARQRVGARPVVSAGYGSARRVDRACMPQRGSLAR